MRHDDGPTSAYDSPAMRAALGLYSYRQEPLDEDDDPISPELWALIYQSEHPKHKKNNRPGRNEK